MDKLDFGYFSVRVSSESGLPSMMPIILSWAVLTVSWLGSIT